jgi:hypothetical protein
MKTKLMPENAGNMIGKEMDFCIDTLGIKPWPMEEDALDF